MPKEKINYPPYIEGPDGALSPGAEITIHWSSGEPRHAQIGFEFDVGNMLAYLTRLRVDSPMDSRATFYTSELSRDDLQRMIRAGKRARDAVFGADE
jgi:hypothetical protein